MTKWKLSNRGVRLVIIALVLASYAVWRWLHRYWFIQADEFHFATMYGARGGRFTAQQWWDALVDDWWRRTGRLADSFLRLLIRPGEWLYPWVGPLLLTLIGVGAALLLTRGRAKDDPAKPWFWLIALLIVPVGLWLQPDMTGDAVFWATAAVNYVPPLAMVLFCTLPFLAISSGAAAPRWPAVVGWSLLMVLTNLLHEQPALSLFGIAVLAVLAGRPDAAPGWRHRLPAQGWVLVAVNVVTTVVHMGSPGFRSRIVTVQGAGVQQSTVDVVSHNVALSSTYFLGIVPVVSLLVLGCLVALGLVSTKRRGTRLDPWAVVAAAGLALWLLTTALYGSRMPLNDHRDRALPPGLLPEALLTVLGLLVACVAIFVFLFVRRERLGLLPVYVWVAFVGSSVIVFGSGVFSPRAYFTPLMLYLLLMVSLAVRLAAELGPVRATVVVAALAACLAVASASWFMAAQVGLRADKKYVDRVVLPQIQKARAGQLTTVKVPRPLPDQDMAYANAFLVPRYTKGMILYYELPSDVKFVQQRPATVKWSGR